MGETVKQELCHYWWDNEAGVSWWEGQWSRRCVVLCETMMHAVYRYQLGVSLNYIVCHGPNFDKELLKECFHCSSGLGVLPWLNDYGPTRRPLIVQLRFALFTTDSVCFSVACKLSVSSLSGVTKTKGFVMSIPWWNRGAARHEIRVKKVYVYLWC